MSDRPRVSLGMPVYNGSDFLEETLDSVLGQTFKNFELIICDNASTDRTSEICKAYLAKDDRIQYHRNEVNVGAARNYNLVFEMSSGEYFKWAAHDDLMAPSYLEKCISELDKDPNIVLCYPNTIMVDKNGEATGANPGDHLDVFAEKTHQRLNGYLYSSHVNRKCHAVFGLIRREVLAKTGLIGAYSCSDFILLAELAMHGPFMQITDKLFFRREHPKSSVNANPSDKERNVWFDPENKKADRLQNWVWFSEYLYAINRVEMGFLEKGLCYLQMNIWLRRNRFYILNELRSYFNNLWQKTVPSELQIKNSH